MHDYKNLNLWCRQAHTHVEKGDGDKLADLNDREELVPYEQPGMFAGFFAWKVGRHTGPLKASWQQLTEEASELGVRVGIRERIAEKPDDKNLDEVTIRDLATRLDRLLLTPQVQLVKARAAFEDTCQECRNFLERGPTVLTRNRAIRSFEEKLEEVYQQLNHTTNNPQANLSRLQQLLENDVHHTLIKLGVDPTHPQVREAEDIANWIDGVFKAFIDRHQQEIRQSQRQRVQQAPQPSENEDLQRGFEKMIADLKDNTKWGPDLNQRIRDLAKKTEQFVTAAQNPGQMLQWVKDCCSRDLQEVEGIDDTLKHSTRPMHEAIEILEATVATQAEARHRHSPPLRATESPALATIMQKVADYAAGRTEDQSSKYCREIWQEFKRQFETGQATADSVQQEFSTLLQHLSARIETAQARSMGSNIYEEILLPLLAYMDSLAEASPPPQVAQTQPPRETAVASPEAAFQGQPQVTGEQLRQQNLIKDGIEYAELQQLIPQQLLTHPNIFPSLWAFRNLQIYNPGLTNQDFGTLVKSWSPQGLQQWAKDIKAAYQPERPFYEAMRQPVGKAIKVIARARQVPPHLCDVVDLLDMNALSSPYLVYQLETLSVCEKTLQGSVERLSPQDMAYLLNRNLLVPLHMDRMRKKSHDPNKIDDLRKDYQGLGEVIRRTKEETAERLRAYNVGVTQNHLTRYKLRPYQVPADGDCFYSAIGHLVREPMRQVRQRCHGAAQDILAMAKGTFRGSDPDYAQRVRNAVAHADTKRLQRQVDNKILLTPSFERNDKKDQAWGEDDDLALVALVYKVPFVPVSPENGCLDLYGYGTDGEKYQNWDFEKPDALSHLYNKYGDAPLQLIRNEDHWDPLVANR